MNISKTFEPPEQVGAAPTRRAVLAVGGGISLAAVLSACGVRGLAAAPAETALAAPQPENLPFVRITTTGATFNPVVDLAAGSNSTVSWVVEGGFTVTGLSPRISFGSAAARHVRMTVDDGGVDSLDEVVTFNLGFNHGDDAGKYNMGARYDKEAESVALVENISRLTGLRRFAAARTTLGGALDFTGCSRLQFIEGFKSKIQSLDVTGCTSLIRICVEQTNLATLDLNPVAATLRDLRGAEQEGGKLTLTPLSAPMAALYHFCMRDQILVNHPSAAQLPVVEELWSWNTSQTGALRSTSGALRSLSTSGNHYTTADLTNQFPAGRVGALEANNNSLTAIALAGCDGLSSIALGSNRLGTAAVDGILAVVASWGTSGGVLNLSSNSAPGMNGVASIATLTGRGWKVATD